jgi:hypothetical protein
MSGVCCSRIPPPTVARRESLLYSRPGEARGEWLFRIRHPRSAGPRGGVVTQRSAKPCTPVQFRAWPPLKFQSLRPDFQKGSFKPDFGSGNPLGTLLALHAFDLIELMNGDDAAARVNKESRGPKRRVRARSSLGRELSTRHQGDCGMHPQLRRLGSKIEYSWK